MSLPLPTPANNYLIHDETQLDPDTLNPLFGSIAARFLALENVNTGLEQLKNDLQHFGLIRLDEAIVPLIEQTRADLLALAADVAATSAANALIIANFQAITAVNLEAVAAAVAAAIDSVNDVRAQIDLMLDGGLPASKVAESATQVFVTPAQRTEIGTLRTNLTALGASVSALTFASYRPWVVAVAPVNALPWQRIKVAAGVAVTFPPADTEVAEGAVIDIWPVGLGQTIIGNGRLIEGFASITIDQPGVGLTLAHDAGAWRIQRWSIINNG